MIRTAIVGCGTAASLIHLPGLRRTGRFDVTTCASRSRGSATRVRDEWGSGQVVDSWHEVVDDPAIDAVVIATPNAQHAEVSVAASRAGKHVLVEKPMATSVAEADAMIAAARETGTVLMPAHNLRFAAPFDAARRAVAEGMVGEVTGARVAFGHAGPQHWAPHATWFFDMATSGGGALIDLGVHAADLVRTVVADDIVEVAAFLRRRPDGVDEAAQVTMRFAAGAIGSLHASWVARPGPDHQLTVFGTDGTLHLDGQTPLTFRPADGTEARTVPLPPREQRTDLYAGFADAVEHGTPPPVTAADGRAAVAFVTTAYEAARTGRSLPLPIPA
jgi:UDP-N-acetylglucosamine 3-dehydrogenase